MPWKGVWSIVSVLATAAATGLTLLAGWPTLAGLGFEVALAVAWLALARVGVHRAAMFEHVPADAREQMVRFMGVGAAAHLGWTAGALTRPEAWPVWAVTLPTIGAVSYWTAAGHQYLLERAPEPDLAPAVAGQQVEPVEDQVTAAVARALRRAEFGWLTVLDWEPFGDDDGVSVILRRPSAAALKAAGHKTANTGANLTLALPEPFALGLSEVLPDHEIMSDYITCTKLRAAGRYKLTIAMHDVMAAVRPYTETPTWQVSTEPKRVGWQPDKTPIHLDICQHGRIIGKARSGKSSLVHVLLAHATLCEDAVVWVAGRWKLYDAMAGWVEPYEGRDDPLPFDVIASGQDDVLQALVAAMRIGDWRQRQPMSARARFMRIFLVLDEASFALRDRTTQIMYDGQRVTASRLAAMIMQGAGSAGVHLWVASQRGTLDHWGDYGGDISANAGFSAAFRTSDQQDPGRVLGDYTLPMPRHDGEFWLVDGDDPVRAKGEYIQEIDPRRDPLHDGLTLTDVALSRRAFHTELDEGSAAVAGDWYTRRHRHMTPQMLEYLTGTPPLDDDEEPPTPEQIVEAELRRKGLDRVAGTPTPGARMASVATLDGRRPRADRIRDLVVDAGQPMTFAQIVAGLADQGDHANPNVITNALTRLVNTRALHRPERGIYTGPVRGSDHG